jgi:hypothetical protein
MPTIEAAPFLDHHLLKCEEALLLHPLRIGLAGHRLVLDLLLLERVLVGLR